MLTHVESGSYISINYVLSQNGQVLFIWLTGLVLAVLEVAVVKQGMNMVDHPDVTHQKLSMWYTY